MRDSPDQTFSPNSAISEAIREMLPEFSTVSQRRMKKAIIKAGRAANKHQDENTDAGARHIFREFIPAYLLNRCGYRFEYNEPIGGKTPDWLDLQSGLLIDSYTYERGGKSAFEDRIQSAVSYKCVNYRGIISAHSLRFVVSVYLDFLTGLTLDRCSEDSARFRPVFEENESLWGVLFFTEDQRGVPIGGVPYGLFCWTANSDFLRMPNWKLRSQSVYDFAGAPPP